MASTPFGNVGSPGGAIAELAARAGGAGILWSAQKFPWVKIESFAEGCSLVLESDGSQPLYEGGFIRPRPIVTKVSVKKQGELGTTRRAIVSMTAFSDEQLLELESCFFIPGMSVRVQFGWSKGITGQPSAISGPMPDTQAVCKLSNSGPAMDGVQGRVANFNYTLTSNNTWDCSVEIISAAEGVGGSSFDNNCCKCPIKVKDEKGEEVSKNVPNILAMFIHLASDSANASNYSKALSGPNSHVMTADYNADPRDPDGSAATGFFSMITSLVDSDVTETYISYGALESAINANIPTGGGKNVAGKIDSSKTDLKVFPTLMSADPRVCLVNNGSQSSILDTTSGTFPAFNGKLHNIMINCIYLGQVFRKIYDSQGSMKEFIEDVLAGINDACGGPWEFDIISGPCGDNEDVPTIQVISNKGLDSGGSAIPTKALRDVKFDLKLTDAMKTAALYSNRSTDTSLPCSKKDPCPAIALSSLTREKKNKTSPPVSERPPCECEGVTDEEIVGEPLTFSKALEQLNDEVTDATVQGFKPLLVESYKGDTGKQKDECEGTYLPLSFGFTCDGVGGFKFGQIITSDRLSNGDYVYQITSVEHEVSTQDWTTTVSTVTRFKP